MKADLMVLYDECQALQRALADSRADTGKAGAATGGSGPLVPQLHAEIAELRAALEAATADRETAPGAATHAALQAMLAIEAEVKESQQQHIKNLTEQLEIQTAALESAEALAAQAEAQQACCLSHAAWLQQV